MNNSYYITRFHIEKNLLILTFFLSLVNFSIGYYRMETEQRCKICSMNYCYGYNYCPACKKNYDYQYFIELSILLFCVVRLSVLLSQRAETPV